jgi:hypothetical protein
MPVFNVIGKPVINIFSIFILEQLILPLAKADSKYNTIECHINLTMLQSTIILRGQTGMFRNVSEVGLDSGLDTISFDALW